LGTALLAHLLSDELTRPHFQDVDPVLLEKYLRNHDYSKVHPEEVRTWLIRQGLEPAYLPEIMGAEVAVHRVPTREYVDPKRPLAEMTHEELFRWAINRINEFDHFKEVEPLEKQGLTEAQERPYKFIQLVLDLADTSFMRKDYSTDQLTLPADFISKYRQRTPEKERVDELGAALEEHLVPTLRWLEQKGDSGQFRYLELVEEARQRRALDLLHVHLCKRLQEHAH
jgi:hypothetical protein